MRTTDYLTRGPSFSLSVREDVELRLLGPEHATLVHAEIERSRAHLRQWLPWVDRSRHPRDTRPYLERSRQGFSQGDGFSLGIFENGTFTGVVGFHAFDQANRVTSLGYWLGQGFQGRGLMTAAVVACLGYAFEERHMNRVCIRCATGNFRSQAIPKRLGFSYEGTQRQAEWLYDHFVDLELYSLLAPEWEARKQPR